VVQWVENNAAKYKANAKRVFIWSQSAGNVPTATYVGHPELYGPKGLGLKGVIFMSPPAFDILPATVPPGGGGGGFGACGQPNGGPPATPPAGRGGGGRGPGGPGAGDGRGGKGGAKASPPDPATQLARSNLPGLVKSKIPYMLIVAELDPPNILGFSAVLKDQLCKAGHCPTYLELKDHSHVSEVFAPNTADDSVTAPILAWMKGVK
jgi:triacylglycerol lipase